MNSLDQINQELLESIKQRIAFASGLENTLEWAQKDYEFLVFFIEDETGVRLSLSTIKRIWRNEYNRLPHISTLDTLSKLAYKKDWLSLKKQWLEQSHQSRPVVKNRKGEKRNPFIYIIPIVSLVLIVVIVGFFSLNSEDEIALEDYEAVTFSCRKSVDGKIPNTVVFDYNIETVKADRFFLQQSWDKSRRVEIYKGNTKRTDIYYVPGYYTARLLADEHVIKEIPVHITYDDWFMAARQPISNIRAFEKKYWLDSPYLGISEAALTSKKIDLNQEFQLAFYYVKEFDLDGDNFGYSVMFKMNLVEAFSCPKINLHVQAEKGHYWIMFGNKGCESELIAEFSNVLHDGKIEDLTMFGTDMYEWQQFDITVVNKKVTVRLNDKTIFSSTYNLPIGAIKEISYFFDGIGVIDNVVLKNGNGEITFSDDFEESE